MPDIFLQSVLKWFNSFPYSNNIPSDLVQIRLIPFFKSGTSSNPSNYRTRAILSNVVKLYAALLRNRLNNWSEEHAIIADNQAGFRKGRSTLDLIFIFSAPLHHRVYRKKSQIIYCFCGFL